MHHPLISLTLGIAAASMGVVPTLANAQPAAHGDREHASTSGPLLQQAHFLLSFYRLDLVQSVLQKVLAVEPNHPEALLMLGDLALRESDNRTAESILQRLKSSHPDHPFTRDMAALWQLHTVDRLRLSQLRSLRTDGNVSEGSRLAHALFPDNLPPGSLLPEFADLLANTPSSRAELLKALPKRLAYSGAPRDRLTLYGLQSQTAPTLLESLRGFAQIARERSVPPDQFAGPWRRALDWAQRGGAGPEGQRVAAADEALYQRSIPQDVRFAVVPYPVTSSTGSTQRAARPGAASVDLTRAFASIEQGKYNEAEALFNDALRQQPNLGAAQGGLGIIRLRQGKLQASQALFVSAVANEQNPQAKSDWQSLANMARYKSQLGSARELVRAGRLSEADALLLDTLPLATDPSDVTLMLADVRAKQGQFRSADDLYAKLLENSPTDTYLWRYRFSNGVRHPEMGRSALDWLNEIESQARKHQLDAADMFDADALREATDRETTAGNTEMARTLLERGLVIEGKAAWLRHDLARLHLKAGRNNEAQVVMAQGVAQAPKDAQMRLAAALIAQAGDRDDDGLALLDAVPEDERTASHETLRSSLKFESALRQHRQALAKGDRAASVAAVQQADRETQGLVSRGLRTSRAEIEAGLPEAANRRLDGLASAQLTLAQRIEVAQLRAQAGQGDLAQRQLTTLASQAKDAETVIAVLSAQEAVATQRIEQALRSNSKAPTALALAGDALTGWPLVDGQFERRRTLAQTRLFLAARAPEQALSALQTGTAPSAEDALYADWQRLQIQAYHAAGKRKEAQLALSQWHDEAQRRATKAPAGTQPTNTDDAALLDVALANDIGAHDWAQSWLEPLLAARPNEPSVRLEASRTALGAGHYDAAAMHLRAVQSTTTGRGDAAGVSPVASSLMDVLEQRRQARFEAGAMFTHDRGRAGISHTRSREIPLRLTWPLGYERHVFMQIDAIKVDAGALPANADDNAEFGTLRSVTPPVNLAAPIEQRQQGANVALGFEGDRQRFDIGVIGVGTPVRNWVGGWQRTVTRNETDLGFELARRVETQRVLPYVGAIDPVTGQTWGGVTRTSGAISLGRSLNDTDRLQSTIKAAFYDGRHVISNRAWQWRTALTRDVVRSEPLNLNIGLTGMLWRFQRNSNFYSWGHGGYYSPQRYFSLGIPVELTGRQHHWSYLLRASVSYAWARAAAAAFYPLDPTLLPGGAGYGGSKSNGLGGSLRGQLERRLSPHWDLGAWLDIDRSENYRPTRGMVYMRYHFKPQGDAIPVPPRPLVPYSQY